MGQRGRKREVQHEKVIQFALANPELKQSEVAAHFGISQKQVSRILRRAGIEGIYRGRPPKPRSTDEQSFWEKRLHDLGLGMERGLRINNKRIFYTEDPRKESIYDHSVTLEAA